MRSGSRCCMPERERSRPCSLRPQHHTTRKTPWANLQRNHGTVPPTSPLCIDQFSPIGEEHTHSLPFESNCFDSSPLQWLLPLFSASRHEPFARQASLELRTLVQALLSVLLLLRRSPLPITSPLPQSSAAVMRRRHTKSSLPGTHLSHWALGRASVG